MLYQTCQNIHFLHLIIKLCLEDLADLVMAEQNENSKKLSDFRIRDPLYFVILSSILWTPRHFMILNYKKAKKKFEISWKIAKKRGL